MLVPLAALLAHPLRWGLTVIGCIVVIAFLWWRRDVRRRLEQKRLAVRVERAAPGSAAAPLQGAHLG